MWELAEGEGGGGDATDGQFLGSGAAAEACHQDHGDHIIGIQAGAGGLGSDGLRANGMLIYGKQQHRQRLLQRWGRWQQPLAQQFDPNQPPLHKLLHRCGVAEIELPRWADHHHLPVADRAALQHRSTEHIGPAEKGDMAAAQQRWLICASFSRIRPNPKRQLAWQNYRHSAKVCGITLQNGCAGGVYVIGQKPLLLPAREVGLVLGLP